MEISFKVAVWGYSFGFSFQIGFNPALSLFVWLLCLVYTDLLNGLLCVMPYVGLMWFDVWLHWENCCVKAILRLLFGSLGYWW